MCTLSPSVTHTHTHTHVLRGRETMNASLLSLRIVTGRVQQSVANSCVTNGGRDITCATQPGGCTLNKEQKKKNYMHVPFAHVHQPRLDDFRCTYMGSLGDACTFRSSSLLFSMNANVKLTTSTKRRRLSYGPTFCVSLMLPRRKLRLNFVHLNSGCVR